VVWVKANVEGDGRACHTGERSCFFRTLPLGEAASPDLRLQRDAS
jgi:phosphoribosyl-AMP cyclohydrolase